MFLATLTLVLGGCGWWPSETKIRKGFDKPEFAELHQYTLSHLELFNNSVNSLGVRGTSNPQAPEIMQKYMEEVGVRYIRISEKSGNISYVFRSDWESSTGIEYAPSEKKWYEANLKEGDLEDWGDGFYYYNFL